MQLEIEALSPIRKRVQVTVPSNRVNADFSRAFSRVAKSARLPGFRSGHVPMGHLRKRYGMQVAVEVTEGLVQAGWTHALDAHNIRPVTQPEVDATRAAQGKDFDMTFTVEVFPDVEIKPYDQFSVERVQWIASDAVVEHELEHVREQVGTFEVITDRDIAQSDDMITFDFEGSLDGVPFEGGKAEDFDLQLGSGQFIPGFEEQLIGQTVGEDFDVTVTFPEDYQAENLAGNEAVFACKIKAIKVKVLPEIGEELAKKLGEEDMDAVRKTVRERIVGQHSRQTDNDAKDALKALVAEAYAELELPSTLLKGMVAEKQREQQAAIQNLIREGKTFDEAREEVEGDDIETAVAAELRTDLVIDAIAEKENVDVSEHEITLFVEQLVRSMGEYGNQIRGMYRDPNQRAQLRRRMSQDKVLDFLLDNAAVKVVNKDVPEHDHSADHDHD
jgi:trigger factor